MLLLANLHALLVQRQFSTARFANLVGLEPKRVRHLEYGRHKTEAWFDEAVMISRGLAVDGIAPLITSGNLTEIDLGRDMPYDLDVFRSGARLPLDIACRIARRFRMRDPIELSVTQQSRFLWSILGAGERDGSGLCPWCRQPTTKGLGHAETCVPDVLWGERSRTIAPLLGAAPKPARKGLTSGSRPAYGMKSVRESMNLTQSQMAAKIHIAPSHVSHYETLRRPLTMTAANKFALILGIDVNRFFEHNP